MELKVGFGFYTITPPLGVPMAGYAQREGVAEDVHDELTARAVAFESEGHAAALVAVDTCMLPMDLCDQVGMRIEERTGIPGSNVIAAAVHTHSGPALHQESSYRWLLPDLVSSAVELAWKRREPAYASYGNGQAEGLCVNRRSPDGPVDETYTYLAFRDGDDQLLGMLFAYPLHGVVMGSNNLALSADYIGVARQSIERCMPGSTAVFVAAPSGEMNPLTPSVRALLAEHGAAYYTADPLTGIYDRTSGTFDEAGELGHQVAEAVLEGLMAGTPLADGPLLASTRHVELGDDLSIEATLRTMRLGDAAIIALAGEHFVATGMRLREMAQDAGLHPIVLSHAGQLTYVPPPEAFAEGGYEVYLARKRGIAEDAQTRILANVRQMLASP